MIRTRGLTKRFGSTVALSNLDLDVARGQCLGLAGVNGCGRTTLLRILATLIGPSAGAVEIDGIDAVRRVYEARSRLAYVGGWRLNGHGLLAREYLTFVQNARVVSGFSRTRSGDTTAVSLTVDAALERSGVPADAAVDALSAGLGQRLALAAAFLTGSRVLLLDDPFRALDSVARPGFVEWLLEVRDRGVTIVVAFNDEREMKAVCHDVAHLDSGRLGSRSHVRASDLGVLSAPIFASGDA